jgi:UDP-N-acetylmuramoyl-tripeptide--D-alanyl-D-alanine ligase
LICLTLNEIQKAVKGVIHSAGHTLFTADISTDSRTVQPGDLFIPLIGERFDGHDFIRQALDKGAKGILIQRGKLYPQDIPSDVSVITVDNTLKALSDLAGYIRLTFNGPVVAVTGSNGKTTTKDMCTAVLSQKYVVLANEGNQNNEVGLPLTLFNLEKKHEAVIVEMGMRGPGQIEQLCEIARPTIGVITNVGNTHLELLGSVENIARAKGELIENLPRNGWAVLNQDDSRVMEMEKRSKAGVITYGQHPAAQVRAEKVRLEGHQGLAFEILAGGQVQLVTLPVPAKHNVYNALAAAAVGLVLGLDLSAIAQGLSQVRLTAMRMQVESLAGGITLINDTYNASPPSVLGALEVLSGMPARRRIAVLGDMLELGEVSESEHIRVGRQCTNNKVDILVCVGDLAGNFARGAKESGLQEKDIFSFSDPDRAGPFLAELIKPGDLILIKASRGVRLERVIGYIKDKISSW